jgi:hypothetical protein
LPEDFLEPLYTDDQKARDYALITGLDRAELEAATEKLLCAYWPLLRSLAAVLVERKVVSGRRARQILFARCGRIGPGRGISPRPRPRGLKLPPCSAGRAPWAVCGNGRYLCACSTPLRGGVSYLLPMRSIVFCFGRWISPGYPLIPRVAFAASGTPPPHCSGSAGSSLLGSPPFRERR